ncbi:DUF6783 domain-containing protein [Blautia glucerasea]|uniref:DUF6783 domain-containing protein n=1 Tax=Blautia TaxID=572511 RepID=UPI003A7F184F
MYFYLLFTKLIIVYLCSSRNFYFFSVFSHFRTRSNIPQSPTKWGVQIAGMIFQTRSSPSDIYEFSHASMAHSWFPSGTFIVKTPCKIVPAE